MLPFGRYLYFATTSNWWLGKAGMTGDDLICIHDIYCDSSQHTILSFCTVHAACMEDGWEMAQSSEAVWTRKAIPGWNGWERQRHRRHQYQYRWRGGTVRNLLCSRRFCLIRGLKVCKKHWLSVASWVTSMSVESICHDQKLMNIIEHPFWAVFLCRLRSCQQDLRRWLYPAFSWFQMNPTQWDSICRMVGTTMVETTARPNMCLASQNGPEFLFFYEV